MTRDEKLALAGDYVLGLLDDTERAALEAAALVDAELGEMVVRLAETMKALDATAQPAEYDASLRSRIERRLDDRTPAAEPIAALPARQPMPATVRQWLPLAASVVVALGLGYALGLLSRPEDRPTVIAVLLSEADATPAVIIEAFDDDSVRLVPLEDFSAPEGQVLQVWTLPDAETGPVSLGTLNRTQDLRLAGPQLPLPDDGQLYEITLEPAPGSPTGRPTGPILVKGFAKPPV